jgi:hypothetical protein
MTRAFLFVLFIISSLAISSAQVLTEQSSAIGIDHYFRDNLLMGGGAAFFDYDLDGDEDVYLTGGYNRDDLYRNNGDGTFTNVSNNIGIDITFQYNTMGVTTGDIDNDGDRDIFVATWERFNGTELPDGRSLLFRNNGNGTFTEIGQQAGIFHEAFAMGAAFVDYNRDGYLDIYVMNHILESIFEYDEYGVQIGLAHECYPNFLYVNNGNNTFTESATELGVDDLGCTIAAVPSDFDMDGDLDLYLANDFGYYLVPNVMYQNNYPENSFSDVSAATGANVEAFGMGIAAGDYDHDLDFDYYTTNIGRNILCENLDGSSFIDVTTEAGVENATVPEENDLNTTGWGTAFFDVDNDTWEDLFVANGRIPALPQYATAQFDPDKLYMNNGDKTFTDVTDEPGVDVGNGLFTHGMAYADYDEDGDLDIITVVLDNGEGKSHFYVNETNNGNNWIQFKLIGLESNRDAFGSKAWVYTSGGPTLIKEIYGGGASHASQHTSVLHFGLADLEQVDSVRIEWTNGQVDVIETPAINERHLIIEGQGISSSVTAVAVDELNIAVAPNPFTNTITLFANGEFAHEELFIRLMAIDGTVMMTKSFAFGKQAQLDLDAQLPSGMYLLELLSEGKRTLRKLIKQ